MTKEKHSIKVELDENCNIEDRCAIGLGKPGTPVKISGEPQIYDLINIVKAILRNPTSPMTRRPVSLAMLTLASSEFCQKELALKLAKAIPRVYIVLDALKDELRHKSRKNRASIQNIMRIIRLFASRQSMLDISAKYERHLIAFFIGKYYHLLSLSSRAEIKNLIFSKGFPKVFEFQYECEQNKKVELLISTGFIYAAPVYGSSFIKAADNICKRLPSKVRKEIERYVESIEQCDFVEEPPRVKQTSVFQRSTNYRIGL